MGNGYEVGKLGGDRAATWAPPARIGPQLTPEEKARAEREEAATRESDHEALQLYKQKPAAHPLTAAQRYRLGIRESAELSAAEAHAEQLRQSADAATERERGQHRERNAELAQQLVGNLRGAARLEVAALVETVRNARIAGHLPEDGSAAIMRRVGGSLARQLVHGVDDHGVAESIRILCSALARRETVESLPADLDALALNLERVLPRKVGDVAQAVFGRVVSVEELAECLRREGRAALHAAAPQTEAAVPEAAAEDYVVKRVPAFPDGKLRAGDEPEGLSNEQWFSLLSTPRRDGPSIVGPFSIRVAGVVVKRESFLIWCDGGKIREWMPASEIPAGGVRRGEWLLWSDGRVLQVIRDRPTDSRQLQGHAPQMATHEVEKRASAGTELNRDLEHYVASGSSIQHAEHQVYKAHRDVLVQLVQDSFRIFGVFAGAFAAEEAIEATGEAIGRLGKKTARGAASSEEHSQSPAKTEPGETQIAVGKATAEPAEGSGAGAGIKTKPLPANAAEAKALLDAGLEYDGEEIRTHYLKLTERVERLNAQWVKEGMTAEQRARLAYDIRKNARTTCRAMDHRKAVVEALRARDVKKYGNPDGPTFEALEAKATALGLKGDAVYEEIASSSQRTDAATNASNGLRGQDSHSGSVAPVEVPAAELDPNLDQKLGSDIEKAKAEAKEGGAQSIRVVNVDKEYPTANRDNNCANCAVATDATLSGAPAAAMPGSRTTAGNLRLYFESRTGRLGIWLRADATDGVTAMLKDWGPGARAVVFGDRGPDEAGHFFNVANLEGKVRFFDGQSGKAPIIEGQDFVKYWVLRTDAATR